MRHPFTPVKAVKTQKIHVVYQYNGILFTNKRNKVLIYDTTRMSVVNIMLSERTSHKNHLLYDAI